MFSDLKFALRRLGRRPLFALSSVLLLGLACGLAGTLATLVRDIMLDPFPYPNSRNFIVLRQELPERRLTTLQHAGRDYLDLQAATADLMAGIGAFRSRAATLGFADATEHVRLIETTFSGMAMTRTAAQFGRSLTEEDERPGAPRVAVIGHALWLSAFGGAPDAVGRSIRLDGEAHTIVGIMPPRFTLCGGNVWVALRVPPESVAAGPREYFIMGFIRPGADLDQVRARMQQHYDRVAATLPPEAGEYRGRRAVPALITEQVLGNLWPTMIALIVAVTLLLLLTAVNLGSLFFLRAAATRHELAVRVVLGASGRALARQLFTEVALIAAAGGLIAAALASVAVPTFLSLTPGNFIPSEALVRVDAPILAGTFGAALLLTALAAAVPAWWSLRLDDGESLAGVHRVRRGSRGAHRAERAIIATEAALAFAIVLCTTHLGLSFFRLMQADHGFSAPGLTTARVLLPAEARRDPALARAALARAAEAVRTLPGAEAGALALGRPLAEMQSREFTLPGRAEGQPGHRAVAQFRAVTEGHFATLGMRVASGRLLAAGDHAEAARVALVNQTLARTYWPGQDPVGQTLLIHPPGSRHAEPVAVTIVGVVRDTLQPDPNRSGPSPELFVPLAQLPGAPADFAVLVRGAGGARLGRDALAAGLRAAIGADVTIYDVTDFDSLLHRLIGPHRLGATILAVLGLASLAITAAGLYSLLAFSLAQRTREMGIRQALGAAPRELLLLFVRRAVGLTAVGMAAGLFAFWLGIDHFDSRVSGRVNFDPTALALAAAALLFATLVAGLLPGLKAARVSPSVALRAE